MIGDTLGGRYHIIEKLGSGAFGQTFKAKDTQKSGDFHCVVKQLKPESRESHVLEIARKLFDREAKTLEKLGDHDRIPQLLDYFEENQEFYLVQQLIEGRDLREEIAPGKPKDESYAIALLRDILEVLAFVHARGVIHRDLKPSNLMRRASDGKIVLIDFGAVKEISSTVMNAQGQIKPTVAIGTHGYMPVEQNNGTPKFCSDIYAVGMIGIQALTGIHPNELSKDPATGEVIWRDRHLVGANVCSPSLGEILDRMVRYRFPDRCQTAAEALQALDSLNNSITPAENLATQPDAPTAVAKPPASLPPTDIPAQPAEIPATQLDAPAAVETPSASPPPTVPSAPPDAPPRQKLWKVFIGAGIAAVLSVSALGYYILAPKPGSLPYENSNLGVKIQYPAKWGVQPDPIAGEVRFFSKGNSAGAPAETFLITVESLQPPVTLDEYTSSFIHRISKEVTADILTPTPASLANREARQVVYTQKEGERRLKTKQIWAVGKDRAYVVTLTAEEGKFAQFEKTAQKMIDSLEIRP